MRRRERGSLTSVGDRIHLPKRGMRARGETGGGGNVQAPLANIEAFGRHLDGVTRAARRGETLIYTRRKPRRKSADTPVSLEYRPLAGRRTGPPLDLSSHDAKICYSLLSGGAGNVSIANDNRDHCDALITSEGTRSISVTRKLWIRDK